MLFLSWVFFIGKQYISDMDEVKKFKRLFFYFVFNKLLYF